MCIGLYPPTGQVLGYGYGYDLSSSGKCTGSPQKTIGFTQVSILVPVQSSGSYTNIWCGNDKLMGFMCSERVLTSYGKHSRII